MFSSGRFCPPDFAGAHGCEPAGELAQYRFGGNVLSSLAGPVGACKTTFDERLLGAPRLDVAHHGLEDESGQRLAAAENSLCATAQLGGDAQRRKCPVFHKTIRA